MVFAIILADRILCFKNILNCGRGEDSHVGTDVSHQLFVFLKSLTQKTLCPNVFRRKHPTGALYYPLGIYWIATNIALFVQKKNRKPITYTDLKDPEHYSSLTLKIVIFFNVILLPALSFLGIGFLPFLMIKNHNYAAVLSIFALIYADLFFPDKPYTVQTRTIGFCMSYILCTTITIILTLQYSPLAFDFNQELILLNDSPVLQTVFRLAVYSFSIISLASLILITFRSAQQGSQFVVSMLITLCILLPDTYIVPILSSLFFALCISFSQLSLDSLNFFRAHWNNRKNDSSWYIRTYGNQKYKFINLKLIGTWSYLRKLFSFDINPGTGHNHVRYKSSWLSQLIENRCFLYSLCIIGLHFINPRLQTHDSSLLLVLFTTISCIAPSVLCCSRFFQGYGPPLHYIDFFTPFNYISLLALVVNSGSLIVPDILKLIIIIDFCLCLLRLLTSFSLKKLSSLKANSLNTSSHDTSKSFISKYICKEESLILEYIHNIKFSKESKNFRISAARVGHYQMIIEVACIMASNKYSGFKSDFYLDLIGFPYIDSSNYSFYDNWQHVFSNPVGLSKQKITHLFINFNDQRENFYFKKAIKPIFKSNFKLITSNTKLSIIQFANP